MRLSLYPTIEPLEARIAPATLVWDGSAGDGSWFTAANWTPDGVPGAADTAILNIASTIGLPRDTSVGSFQQSSGTFTSPSGVTLTVLNSFVWSGGTQSGTGTTALASGGTGSFSGTLALISRSVNNAGAITWESAVLNSRDGASFNNATGGVLDLQGDGAMQFGSSGVNLAFSNAGTIVKTAGAGTFTVATGTFANTGTVRSQSGTIDFTSAVSAAGTFAADVGDTLVFRGATTVNGAVTFENTDLTGGTLTGSGSVSGSWRWNSGSISNAALTFPSGSLVTLPGIANKTLSASALTNSGTFALTGTGNLASRDGATFTNTSSGVFDIQSDADLVFGASGANLVFNNSGTLRKSGGLGTTTIATGNFVNSPGALVQAQTGTIDFTAAVDAGGTFTAAGGAIFFRGSNTLVTDVTFNGVELAGGSIRGTGTVTGNWTWSGGTLGTGGTLTIPSGGTLTLIGDATKTLNAYNVINNGSVILTGAGNLASRDGATFTNTSSGLFDIQSDADLVFGASGANLVFNNSGTLRKSAGAATTDISTGSFTNNSGALVQAQAGTLDFTGAVGAGGTFTAAGGGAVLLTGAATLATDVTFNGVELAGGSIRGTGTVTGSWTWSAGTLGAGGGTLTIPATGVLTLTGPATKTLNAYNVINNGSVILAGTGNLASRDGATFTNTSTGLFDLRTDASVVYAASGIDLVFNNSGTVQKSGGLGVSVFRPGTLNNAALGLVVAQSGTLNLPNPVSTSGTLRAAAGGALTLNGATTVSGSPAFDNIELAGGALAGTATVTGNWSWSAGTLGTGGGTLTISAASVLTLTGGATKTLNAYNVINNGSVILTGTGNLASRDGATFTNASSGLFDIQSDADLVFGASGGNLVFDNSGTLRKSAGAATTNISTGSFTNNSGALVQARIGALNFTGSVGAGGTFTAAGGAVLLTGSSTLATDVTFNGVELAGSLRGTGTVAGGWTWSAGTLGTGGGTLTIPAGGTLTLIGDANKTSNAYNVINNGSVILTGAGNLASRDGATFTNASSGLFDIQSDADLVYGASGANLIFDNSGTLRKSGGTGSSTISGPFTNSGTVLAQSGTLSFPGSGFIQIAGSTQLAGGGLAAASPLNFRGGELTGIGVIDGAVSNTGATVRIAGNRTDVLTITGSYVQGSGGTLSVDIGGTLPGTQHDVLSVGGAATLNGTLAVKFINGFTPVPGNGFAIVNAGTRTGSFGTVTGAGSLTPVYTATGVDLTSVVPPGTFVWDGSESSDWFTAANWTPEGVPGPTDAAVLGIASTIRITPGISHSVGAYTQTTGTLVGSLSVSGDLTWGGGVMSGGSTRVFGALVMNGGVVELDGHQLVLASGATATLSGSNATLAFANGARVSNSGTFLAQNDQGLTAGRSSSEPSGFFNSGSFVRDVGANRFEVGIPFTNVGTVNIGTGLLDFRSGFTQSGAGQTIGAAPVRFSGGVVAATGSILTDVVNTGAVLNPAGSNAAGQLTIDGSYTQSAGGTLALGLGGLLAGTQHDQLVVNGGVTLDGTLEVNSINGFRITAGTSFNALLFASATGTFATLDAPAGIATQVAANGLTLLAQTPSPGLATVRIADVDGDLIIVKVDKGTVPADAITLGPNGEVQMIDLRSVGSKLGGAKVTIEVRQRPGGDGQVDVGSINATGMNLGKVIIDGDLGQIDLGTGSARKSALKSLVVGSLGMRGAMTLGGGVDEMLVSEINGRVGEIIVKRGVENASVVVDGKVDKVVIGGSLVGSAASALRAEGGRFDPRVNAGIPRLSFSADAFESFTVKGNVDGAEIAAEAKIKNVKIVGQLSSDDPENPAILRVGASMDKVVIKGDVKNALIVAGYGKGLAPQTADAKIGEVIVGGRWIASSMVAGVDDPGDDGYGLNDALIADGNTKRIISRIASLVIKKGAFGTAEAGDHFGITAEKIDRLSIAGDNVRLKNGPDNRLLDRLNNDFRVVEV